MNENSKTNHVSPSSSCRGGRGLKPIGWLFLIFLIVGTVYIARTNPANTPWQRNEGGVFGTVYHFTYQHHENCDSLLLAALGRVDASLSMFNDESTVSRINDNRTAACDPLFAEMFALAQDVSLKTGGAFDVTVAPLVQAWGFGRKRGVLPDSAQVDSLRTLVGWQRVKLDSDHVVKDDPRMVMDFSAIAKGFGCDQVARTLDSLGVENYMVEIGGEVVVRGHNQKGKPWHVGVSRPTEDVTGNQELQTVMECRDEAMATSGNYRNYYDEGGRRVAHTISPFTGYPVQHSLLSATVFAPTCAEADAYATAFMVLGLDGAKLVLAAQPHLRAYLIYSSADTLATWATE